MHKRRCFGAGADAGSEVKARTVGVVWEPVLQQIVGIFWEWLSVGLRYSW